MPQLQGHFIKNIEISQFKGIAGATILDFQRINLFIGKYGSGKSTLLEAMTVFPPFASNSPLPLVLDRRVRGRSCELRDLHFGCNKKLLPACAITNQQGKRIALNTHAKPIGEHTGLGFTWEFGGNTIASTFCKEDGNPLRPLELHNPQVGALFPRVVLLDSQGLNNLNELDQQLNQLKKDGTDTVFVDFIREAFDNITGYETITRPSNHAPIAFHLPEGKIYGDYLADGMKYAIKLLLSLWRENSCVVLLEEPENHQYAGVIPILAKLIVQLAVKNDLQLFIATHSPELLCWLSQHGGEAVKIYHVERDGKGKVTARTTVWNDLQLMQDIGWDVGNLVRRFQTLVFVEGETDKVVLSEAINKLKGKPPRDLLIDVIYCGGEGVQKKLVGRSGIWEGFLHLSKKMFILRDIDTKTPEEVRNTLFRSITDAMGKQGWSVSAGGQFAKGENTFTFRKENIIPVGDMKYKPGTHSIDDFTLQILDAQKGLREELGIGNGTERLAVKNPEIARKILSSAQDLPQGLKDLVETVTVSF